MSKTIEIGTTCIGDGCPTFVIAEVGINHNGDMDTARRLIVAARDAGADAVKLQTYITEKRVPSDSPVFDILKQCELDFDDQEQLFRFGRECGIQMFSTPFDKESVEFLQSIDCPAFKVASFDSVNKALLREIAATGKPVIMSTGMTTIEELGEAWNALGGKDDGTGCDSALLHCVSSYPTPDEEANLAIIQLLKSIHGGPVGYSDHTIGVDVPVMAIAAGACIIEKHFTLDMSADGPDHAISADPDTMKNMVEGIRRMEKVMGLPEMGVREVEQNIVPFRRAST